MAAGRSAELDLNTQRHHSESEYLSMERQLPFSGGAQKLLALEGAATQCYKRPEMADWLREIIYLISYGKN